MKFSKRFVVTSFTLLAATIGVSFVLLTRSDAFAASMATILAVINAALGESALVRAQKEQKKFLQIVMARMGLRMAGFLASVGLAIGVLKVPVTPFITALGVAYVVLLIQEVFSIKEKFFTANV